MNCPQCGAGIPPDSKRCVKCGSSIEQQDQGTPPQIVVQVQGGGAPAETVAAPGAAVKSKITAGLLGMFLGGLGIHRFYLGYTGIGVTMLALQILGWILLLVCIGYFVILGVFIWGWVEGILILTGSIDKDAAGRPLLQ